MYQGGSMKLVKWFALVWFAQITMVQAASFDCSKASSKIEKMVCGDDKLSRLEEDLNSAYKAALQDKSQSDAIRQVQKKWMKERNGCPDAACVKLAYEKRLSELTLTLHSGNSNSDELKSSICLQCGSWNIDAANEVLENDRLDEWIDPRGEVLVVDGNSITIPYCGSFTYKVTGSKITVEDDDTKHHDFTMLLSKTKESINSPQCEAEKWTFIAEIADGGWSADFTFNDSSGKTLAISGWNPEREDPDENTRTIGRTIGFHSIQSAKALQTISIQFFQKNGKGKSKTFDFDRFRANAEKYCMELIVAGGPENAGIDNMVVQCENQILDNKYNEFENWSCEKPLSQYSKGTTCKFPDETIDKSNVYSP
jgi:uncharacterized protein